MANEGEDTLLQDECVDNLFDVLIEFEDYKEIEDFTSSYRKQSEAESSDDSAIHIRKIRRALPLPSDTEESDEDHGIEWSDFALRKNSNEFEGSPDPNVFPRDVENVEDVAELFIGNDLFQFISIETNRYYKQNSNRRK